MVTKPAVVTLDDISVVSLAGNLPGPLAAARLASMGASVTRGRSLDIPIVALQEPRAVVAVAPRLSDFASPGP